ncbi:MAG: peptide deformylase [Lachnospiraceae bacterium]|nr:peptide deformylase [Lachnospiraceae bacterium]
MALRTIRTIGDDILTKKCKEVKDMTPRMQTLVDDMFETMYETGGVGLAAPQVGVLRRIVVIDVDDHPITLVNPVITETSGEQTGSEGCLSVPGKAGEVTRPMKVTVRAFDREMNEFTLEGEELLARAICHELDHLEGKLYVDLVEGDLYDVAAEPEEDEEESEEEAEEN